MYESVERTEILNIYCGNRMVANKYEFVEQYRRLSPGMPSITL